MSRSSATRETPRRQTEYRADKRQRQRRGTLPTVIAARLTASHTGPEHELRVRRKRRQFSGHQKPRTSRPSNRTAAGGRLDQAGARGGSRGLAATRLAEQRQRLAGRDEKITPSTAMTRPQTARQRKERKNKRMARQVLHLEERAPTAPGPSFRSSSIIPAFASRSSQAKGAWAVYSH